MKKNKNKQGLIAAAIILGLAVVMPSMAYARNAQDNSVGSNTEDRSSGQQSDSGSQGAQSGSEQGEAKKLSAGKLEACKSREKNINAIMARVADRAKKQLQLLDQVSEKVQAYYRENGVIIEDYDALVAQVQAKKSQAVAASQKVQSQSSGFNCGGNDPKGTASVFKTQVGSTVDSYQSYKTAISDLVDGVKIALEGEQ